MAAGQIPGEILKSRFSTRSFRVPAKGGRVLSIEDPTASLDVYVLPTKIAVMRWPRGGAVRAWTIAKLPPPEASVVEIAST